MPEVPGNPPSPRTALFWDGARWHYGLVDKDGRVQVRGEDQLFSIKAVLGERVAIPISGADGYIESPSVPDGEYWVVTTIAAQDSTTAPTEIRLFNRHDGVSMGLKHEIKAFAVSERCTWSGMTFLDKDDLIRATFTGGLVNDNVAVEITGYRVTVET